MFWKRGIELVKSRPSGSKNKTKSCISIVAVCRVDVKASALAGGVVFSACFMHSRGLQREEKVTNNNWWLWHPSHEGWSRAATFGDDDFFFVLRSKHFNASTCETRARLSLPCAACSHHDRTPLHFVLSLYYRQVTKGIKKTIDPHVCKNTGMVRVGFSPTERDETRRYPGGVVHVERRVFYSVVANRRQTQRGVDWLAESARAWVSNTWWQIDQQWDCWTTLRAIKIEGKDRGGEGTTPVTTACPEAGK